jgi:tetratricopeptide (TPR) repeat protein
MKSEELGTEYGGARQTKLVDRQEILDLIGPTLASDRLWVFHITGKGGMGKTKLAREILQRCRSGGDWANSRLLAMRDVLDLYHTSNHVQQGFAETMVLALRKQVEEDDTADKEQRLAAFDTAFGQYWRADEIFRGKERDLAGLHTELGILRTKIAQGFLEGLHAITQRYHLVLAIDTAEKLLYESDAIQKRLNIEAEGIAVYDWLLDSVLSTLNNATVIITGRAEPPEVVTKLQERLTGLLGKRLVKYSLDKFTLSDALEYFGAVARAAESKGDVDSVERVRAIPRETREVIWHYADGRPILLALMIDYLISSKELLPQVKDSAETAYAHQSGELETIRRVLEEDLVRFWQETHRLTSLAIITLGWTRKGTDAELLARAADLRDASGNFNIEYAHNLLEAIRDLSFVKIRQSDSRFFLHDEMYDLLDRHVLQRSLEPERERVYDAVLEYYREKVKAARQKVYELGQPRRTNSPVGDETVPGLPKLVDDSKALEEATRQLYDLIAEEVHYRLRRNPVDGYHSYRVYAKEASWNNDETQDSLLRSEILDFLKMHHGEEQIDGVRRAEVDVDNGLRHLEQLSREGRLRETVDLGERMQTECADLIERAGSLARLRLDVMRAETMVNLGEEFEAAGGALESAVAKLEKLRLQDQPYQWQQQTTLAEAYNTLGYYYRVLGLFQKAIAAYEQARSMWRQLEDREPDDLRKQAMRAQHANSLNNLAWACAEYGLFQRATRYARDALQMRQNLGPLTPVAYTENTLGLILTRYGRPLEARVHCQRALRNFRDLARPRGIGLACIALAEALRRASDQESLFSSEEKADLLREARDRAEEAVGIFTETIPERARIVEACIEAGCVYRQWAWLRPRYESANDPEQLALANASEESFKKAIEYAGQGSLFFKAVDAHVNLAWLHYYMRDNDRAEQEALHTIEIMPSEYHITRGHGLPNETLPHAFFWVQLGKACSLIGQIAMRRFNAGSSTALEQAGLYFTLSLAYDELFAPDFRDMRRVMDRLYDRLVKLNEEEFKQFHRGIVRAAREYRLKSPLRIKRFLEDYGLPVLEESTP